MRLLIRRPVATAIILLLEWLLLLMFPKASLTGARPRWSFVWFVGATCLWLVVLYVLDTLTIRATFRKAQDRDGRFTYIRPPSPATILFSSMFLLLVQWAGFKVGWLWGGVLQLTTFLFLLARRFENGEARIEALREEMLKVGTRTAKGHALRAFKYKFSLATMYLLVIEAAATVLVTLEAKQYGFYDSSLLLVVCGVGLAGALPIYTITMLPFFFFSRKGAY